MLTKPAYSHVPFEKIYRFSDSFQRNIQEFHECKADVEELGYETFPEWERIIKNYGGMYIRYELEGVCIRTKRGNRIYSYDTGLHLDPTFSQAFNNTDADMWKNHYLVKRNQLKIAPIALGPHRLVHTLFVTSDAAIYIGEEVNIEGIEKGHTKKELKLEPHRYFGILRYIGANFEEAIESRITLSFQDKRFVAERYASKVSQ